MFLFSKSLPQAVFRDLESRNWYRYCSPRGFYPLAGKLIPRFAIVALMTCTVGLYLGFFVAPVDVSPGGLTRITFIHVPATWAALLIFLTMAASAGIGLLLRSPLAAMAAKALAPTGLLFAFLDIWTGCLWNKPIWGNWWVWDLRMVSELALAFFYIGFIGLHTLGEEPSRANKAGALLLLAGVLCVPGLIAAEHTWPARQLETGLRTLDLCEQASLLVLSLGFLMYAGAAVLMRLRCVILEGERQGDSVAAHGGSVP